MTVAYLGIGSNIDPEINIPRALNKLSSEVEILKISPFYRTRAIGTASGQNDFINGVVKIKTAQSANFLKFNILRPIEFSLGRSMDMPKHSPRTIDIDLLIYGDEVIPELNVPEPEICQRPFIYIPLHNIEASFILPINHLSLTKSCIVEPIKLAID